jgi:hypothetical protein
MSPPLDATARCAGVRFKGVPMDAPSSSPALPVCLTSLTLMLAPPAPFPALPQVVTHFLPLEEALDSAVGGTVELSLERGGKPIGGRRL